MTLPVNDASVQVALINSNEEALVTLDEQQLARDREVVETRTP